MYDLQQAFDALWLSDCMIDLFDTLPENKRDDTLALLYTLSEENYVAVKTPHGLTDRMSMPSMVQQRIYEHLVKHHPNFWPLGPNVLAATYTL